MKVIILGSGAGGGLPQWNCGCDNCRAARSGSVSVHSRTQSSIAVSSDGDRWVLFNCSPDVRIQLAATPELHPRGLRDPIVHAIALTNADIDHAAGLLVLREGGAPPVYCTARVRRALTDGLRVLPALESYGDVVVREVTPGETVSFCDKSNCDLGLFARAFTVASKPPPYLIPLLSDTEARDLHSGDTVGWSVTASDGSGRLVYVPGVKSLDEALRKELDSATVVLIDGTCFTDDELVQLGVSTKTARVMGHAPLTGDDGLLDFLRSIDGPRRVLVHINNTNPVLDEASAAYRVVRDAGVEVAHDGDSLTV